MKIKIRSGKDFYAGVIFIFLGGLGVVLAYSRYSMGTRTNIGPGLFPFILGGVLTLLGLLILIRSLAFAGPPLGKLAMKPLMIVLGAVIAFALSVNHLGLAFAAAVLIILSSLARDKLNVKEIMILALLLAAFVIGVFVYGLGLPFKVGPL